VVVPVDEFTESVFSVPLVLKNVPDSLVLKTFPKTVKVKYITTLSNYDRITSEMFQPYVDYNDIDIEMNSKITIQLDSIPSFIHNVQLTPRSVEFLIEKRDNEDWNNRRNR
jgi:hypothetical protein